MLNMNTPDDFSPELPAIAVRCFPALNGDCLLIDFGHSGEKHLLIDFGYVETYASYLRGVLQEIGDRGEFLEKVIITHIDADHILGAKPFLEDQVLSKAITREVWHNTLRHLGPKANPDAQADGEEPDAIRRIRQRGYKGDPQSGVPRAVSAKQGTTIGALLLKGCYPWNTAFGGKAVCIEHERTIAIDENTSVFVLSPSQDKLDALRNLWIKELKKFGQKMAPYALGYDDAFEMWLSWQNSDAVTGPRKVSAAADVESLAALPLPVDNAPANGSSIAFVLTIGEMKLLMLADAHMDLICASLDEYSSGKIFFDLIKVAHHGSAGNISEALLEKIDGKRYLFSTNGDRHNHPDRETIARIIIRPATHTRELIFNYRTANAAFFDREDWKIKYNYNITYLGDEPHKITL